MKNVVNQDEAVILQGELRRESQNTVQRSETLRDDNL